MSNFNTHLRRRLGLLEAVANRTESGKMSAGNSLRPIFVTHREFLVDVPAQNSVSGRNSPTCSRAATQLEGTKRKYFK